MNRNTILMRHEGRANSLPTVQDTNRLMNKAELEAYLKGLAERFNKEANHGIR